MRKNILAIVFLVICPLLVAQQALNNDSIIKLVKAGLSDDLIVSTINAQAGTYDVSTDGLIALKAGRVSDKVVAAIVMKATAPAAVPTALQPAAPGGPSLPAGIDSVGLYYPAKDGSWQEVIAYDVNIGSSGAIKSFTKHMIKGNNDGQVEGDTSRLKLTLPAKFLLYVPEGRSPGEYQLIHFRIVNGNREFSLIARKPNPKNPDAQLRDTVDFDTKKIAPRLYEIDLGKDLGKGEYGLLPPSVPGSTGKGESPEKIYTFSFTG